MSKAKINYTDEQTLALVAGYRACNTHDDRIEYMKFNEFDTDKDNILAGKSERSQRSKLVNEKEYIKAKTTSKVTGGTPAKKEAMASELVKVAGANLNADGKKTLLVADSLEKMNKTDIQFFITKINNLYGEIDELNAFIAGDDETGEVDSEPTG